MSGRGTMISRARVSPNSMIDSMSSRSSCSITSSSAAASTMPRSSFSDTNGPCFRPRPGNSTLARPINPREMMRSGGNETSMSVVRAVMMAARSECRTAHVLGNASDSTKNTITFSTKPTSTPMGPNSESARIVVRNACPVWRMVIITRSGLMNRSGCSTSDTNAAVAFDGRSSAMVIAFTLEMRLSDVSATAR